MSTEVFLPVGSLLVAVIAFVSASFMAGKTRRPIYQPVRVRVTSRSPNSAKIFRSGHILK